MMTSRFNLFMIVAVVCAVVLGLASHASCNARQEPPVVPPLPPPPPQFTEEERKAIAAYWSAPGRYVAEPAQPGSERVNLTVPGSTWHWNYARIPSDKKTPANIAAWEAWIRQRIAYDKAMANRLAVLPPDPVPTPPTLKAAIGDAPPFFERVRPLRYTITFAPEDAPTPFVYTDNIPRTDRYQYYRSANGVMKVGKHLKNYTGEDKRRMDAVFARVGRTDVERRVLRAVSEMEGGFEAINTYDTGWVSIGFIQFITAREGTGSLAAVLARHKADDPKDYQATFRRFGIDVGSDTVIVAVDPQTGQEKRGWDAVQAIIDDKRLTAVFERAGNLDGFRAAQVTIARERYWPGDDPVTVTMNTIYEQVGSQAVPTNLGVHYGLADTLDEVKAALMQVPQRQMADPTYRLWLDTKVLTAKVSDVVRSEAGLATLMDRKVNRGNIRVLNDVASTLMRDLKLTRIEDLARYERLVTQAMKYRDDFLKDATLTQPAPTPPEALLRTTVSSPVAPR